LERELTAIRLKYDVLYNQVTTQGAAATARAAETGEDAFRLPNGELMTADKFMERTRMLTQTRASLEKNDIRLKKVLAESAELQKQKDAASNESRRLEILLSRFEQSRRYEVFTSDANRETLVENSRLVDQVDELQKKLGEALEEISILRRRSAGGSSASSSPHSAGGGIKMTSAFLGSDGSIPDVCPLGGCLNYNSVQGDGKYFQNHMNNVHRVGPFLCVTECAP
jgi:hypothetical protein